MVTANKELMALCGPDIWDRAIRAGVNVAMEASVAGGIPIHAVLREGISGDRVEALYGILNGTSNYILTEMEKHGESARNRARRGPAAGLRRSQSQRGHRRLRRAFEAGDPFGPGLRRADHALRHLHGRHPPHLARSTSSTPHRLGHTIRLICAARQTKDGLILSVRPSLIPKSTILASVQGSYNAVWVKGHYGEDTFYYGRGAGSRPTGVAVVSDLMRVAREIRFGQSGARLAVRARAPGRVQADPRHPPEAGLLPAVPRDGPAGDHLGAGRDPGREAHQPGSRAATARARTSTTCRL